MLAYPIGHCFADSRDLAQLPNARVLYPASAAEVTQQRLDFLRAHALDFLQWIIHGTLSTTPPVVAVDEAVSLIASMDENPAVLA